MAEESFLENLPAFSMLSPDERRKLSAQSKHRHYAKNQVLFYAGDAMTTSYILSSGYVRIEKSDRDDTYHYLDFLNSGKLFPLMGTESDVQYHYSAIAQTDIEITIIPISVLRELFTTNVAFLTYWMKEQSRVLKQDMMRIQGLSVNNALDRVIAILKALAVTIGEKNVVTQQVELRCPVAIKDIATMSGTTRETAGIMMRRLRNMGWIEYQRKHVVYLDGFLQEGGEL